VPAWTGLPVRPQAQQGQRLCLWQAENASPWPGEIASQSILYLFKIIEITMCFYQINFDSSIKETPIHFNNFQKIILLIAMRWI